MKVMLKTIIACAFFLFLGANIDAQSPVNKKVNKGDSTCRDNTAVRNSTAKKASPYFGKDLDSSKQMRNTPKKGKRDTMYVVPKSSHHNKK
jgi:putative salt-induced outer membrane protein YdiY